MNILTAICLFSVALMAGAETMRVTDTVTGVTSTYYITGEDDNYRVTPIIQNEEELDNVKDMKEN